MVKTPLKCGRQVGIDSLWCPPTHESEKSILAKFLKLSLINDNCRLTNACLWARGFQRYRKSFEVGQKPFYIQGNDEGRYKNHVKDLYSPSQCEETSETAIRPHGRMVVQTFLRIEMVITYFLSFFFIIPYQLLECKMVSDQF